MRLFPPTNPSTVSGNRPGNSSYPEANSIHVFSCVHLIWWPTANVSIESSKMDPVQGAKKNYKEKLERNACVDNSSPGGQPWIRFKPKGIFFSLALVWSAKLILIVLYQRHPGKLLDLRGLVWYSMSLCAIYTLPVFLGPCRHWTALLFFSCLRDVVLFGQRFDPVDCRLQRNPSEPYSFFFFLAGPYAGI